MSQLFENKSTQLFGLYGTPEESFIAEINSTGEKLNKQKIIALAKANGVNADETQIKELYEVAIMRALKNRLTNDIFENYQTAREIYNNQVNFAHRTSNSVLLQQYSTPLPLAYLAGAYIKSQKLTAAYFEPSAGNGLLTVALLAEYTVVNEIDRNRRANLTKYGNFIKVYNLDGSKPFPAESNRVFDGIVTNPPFGRWDTEKIGGYPIKKLEHIMSIRALDTMKNSGRAAIIIGGHTEWDKYDRVENGANRYFLSYLYHYYHVDDVINIDGQMYRKQGTTFPIRLILINGRKNTPDGTAPLKTDYDRTVRTFDELWERMAGYFDNKGTRLSTLERQMQTAIAEMEKEMGVGRLNGTKKSIPKYLTKPLSAYTFVENGTDLTDWRAGADEISERIKQRRNFGLEIPYYYYTRLSKLLDKIEAERDLH